MIAEQSFVRRLEACVQEEIGAQGRILGILKGQEDAILVGDPTTIEAQGRAVEEELRRQSERGRRRGALLAELGHHWGVDASTLTLGSVAERLGAEGERLARQREGLRAAVAQVARSARRLGSVARLHQRLMSDVIAKLVGGVEQDAVTAGGVLVDAEA